MAQGVLLPSSTAMGTLLPIRTKGAPMHLEACNGPHSVFWSGLVQDGCMYLVFSPFFPVRLQMTQNSVYIKLLEDLCKNGLKFRATIFVLVL